MEELSDELVIDRQDDSTTVTMIRSLPTRGPERRYLAHDGRRPRDRDCSGAAAPHELAAVSAAEHGGTMVVSISGEVDISNIDSVAEVIYAQPNTGDGLIIDLSEVSYLDSSAGLTVARPGDAAAQPRAADDRRQPARLTTTSHPRADGSVHQRADRRELSRLALGGDQAAC